jgi:ABC-type nitrate/sulfonate/bicarbonate transport system substrate-binding protein
LDQSRGLARSVLLDAEVLANTKSIARSILPLPADTTKNPGAPGGRHAGSHPGHGGLPGPGPGRDGGIMRRTPLILAAALAAAAVTAGGCSSAPAPSAGPGGAGLTTVTLALDWTPNTNHTGIFAAEELGYFKAAGINLKIIPYGSTAPETLVSSHQADFGISYQDGLTEAAATGEDITSVFAVTQKTDVVIGVRADRSDISSPKDLDGKTYAGWGSPIETPLLRYVIQHAGGTGTFKNVTLNTDAYQALYAGQADFALPEPTWEVLQAQLVGKPLKTFDLSDYGFPAIYSVLVASSHQYLNAHQAVAKKFIGALYQGYEYAAAHPAAAANLLIQANSSVLSPQRTLVDQSAALEAAQYYKDGDGQIGAQTTARWQALTDFLFTNKILTDGAGKPLTKEPDVSALFTNAYLPYSPVS